MKGKFYPILFRYLQAKVTLFIFYMGQIENEYTLFCMNIQLELSKLSYKKYFSCFWNLKNLCYRMAHIQLSKDSSLKFSILKHLTEMDFLNNIATCN